MYEYNKDTKYDVNRNPLDKIVIKKVLGNSGRLRLETVVIKLFISG